MNLRLNCEAVTTMCSEANATVFVDGNKNVGKSNSGVLCTKGISLAWVLE